MFSFTIALAVQHGETIDDKWKVQIEKMMEEMPLMIQMIQNSRKFIEKQSGVLEK